MKSFIVIATSTGFTLDVATSTINAAKFKDSLFCGDIYKLGSGKREGRACQEGRGIVVGVV